MKQFAIFISVLLLCTWQGAADQPLKAKLTRSDGRAWRVILDNCNTNQLTYQLENDSNPKTLPLSEVQSLEIRLPKLDLEKLNEQLVSTDYQGVVSVLEPAVGGAGSYMVVSNNAVSTFALLTKAWLRNGNLEKARSAAVCLQSVSDSYLKETAKAFEAQCVLEEGNLSKAKELTDQLKDKAARLYLIARLQRAQKQSKEAMQTVIELIAFCPNDHDWMPPAEYLCAELYLDLGMLDSAAEVAHQVSVIYPGSEFKIEAGRLHEKIQQLIKEQSGQAE